MLESNGLSWAGGCGVRAIYYVCQREMGSEIHPERMHSSDYDVAAKLGSGALFAFPKLPPDAEQDRFGNARC